MTREEAIENLKKLKSFHNGSYGSAVKMAISALEATQEPCDDAISGEKVADALTELVEMIDTGSQRDLDRADELSRQIMSAIKPCEDAISRVFNRMWNCRGKNTTSIDKVKMEQIIREELPPVQPSRKGHWKEYIHSAYHGVDEYDEPIWREVTVYHCSECNRRTVIKEHFCPNCGASMADMRGAE